MPIKVMLISATDHVSGPAKGIFQFFEHLDGKEVKISLYTFCLNESSENLFSRAARERNIPLHLLHQKGRSYVSLIRQTVRDVRREGFDIVQTHGFKPTFLGFFAKMLCKVRWICFMHGTTSEDAKVAFYNLVDAVLQRGADRTVLVSEAQRRRIMGGGNTERVLVLHNAVDLRAPMARSADALSVREFLGVPPDFRVVVTVGRVSPEKGMDVLIQAFRMLRQNVEQVMLVLVGEGQERPSLERQVKALGLDRWVRFTGFTETPGDYLEGADLFVLPSRSEGIPNAVLEAMALGIPVVATAVGGVPEIITDGEDGRLVPPEDPGELAGAMAELLRDPQLRTRFIENGKERVEKAFSIEARVAGLRQIYDEIQ